jgi:dipeptidyl aminopeptidase/acylaminoacyl peptidase
MTRRLTFGLTAFAAILALSALIGAQGQPGQDVKADYDRANSLTGRVANKLFNVADAPNWIPGGSKLWYRKSAKGANQFQFVLVDAAAATKAPAFDHTKLAAAIGTAASATYTATTLPFTTFTYVENMQAIEFAIGGGGGGRGGGAAGGRGGAPAAVPGQPAAPRYHCTLTTYECTKMPDAPAGPPVVAGGAGGQGRAGGGGRAGGAPAAAADQPPVRPSPDGKLEAFIQNYNIFLRPVAAATAGAGGNGRQAGAGGGRQAGAGGGNGRQAQPVQLSWDGSEGDYYYLPAAGGGGGRGGPIVWSPDSKRIAAFRRRPGYQRMVNYVQSSPSDQLQPKSSSMSYQKPGDVVNQDQPVLFDVESKREVLVDSALFPNPYALQSLQWRRDNRAFVFDYNQRGHQVYRVIEVDAATGKARAVIDEKSDTFIDYRTAAAGLSDSGRQYRLDLNDGKEVIWMSERDGWSHLYLYDGVTGQVKNQITRGNWVVHSVDRVDEPNRQIYFLANGMDAGKDPYFLNYCRINFDGTGLTRYTRADGMHGVPVFSPDRQFYVDSYSRVDLPAVSELRRASDQALVMELEKADATDLLATGWKMPEVFTAKGRDGSTDIWGIIVRPTNFDPAKKYPVIENIYAGPQGSFVPKTFGTQAGMQTLAELGFIVVQIDGMGTANRSKAFHAVAFKNLGDAGFPDRILWHKAVAARYPSYDATRVGIYGTSAGGQNSAGAVIFHPEFYKAAASSAGCHDNRMDKIWWNEQWMSWPIGPEYAASSNMENAAKLGGALFLLVGEMDNNVDPSSTMQVVNRLIQANKDFDLLVIPNAQHTNGGAYGDHKRFDFFVYHLQGRMPPPWTAAANGNQGVGGVSVLDEDAMPWVASEWWQ